MNRQRFISLVTIGLGLWILPAAVHGGPDWTEVGDAGKINAQMVALPVQPETITGFLGGPVLRMGDADGGPDVADVYDILITAPQEFMATTYSDPTFDLRLEMIGDDGEPLTGPTNFDTALWLFRLDRRGLLANRNIDSSNELSRILPIATDGTGSRIPGPGRYLLAVSYGDMVPLSNGGQVIFNFSNPPGPDQVSGPDGPGGSMQFASWTPDVERPMVKYRIRISPRDCRPCPGDADGNGVVNFLDITTVLSRFGSTCPF